MVTKDDIRLSRDEVDRLKSSILKKDPKAKLYLFGSRVDSSKRGGDIDLVIISDKLTKRDIRDVRLDFFEEFEEQKIDIVLDTPEYKKLFTKIALKESVEL